MEHRKQPSVNRVGVGSGGSLCNTDHLQPTGRTEDRSDSSVVESCCRLKLPVRDYLAAVLPGLGDRTIQRLPELGQHVNNDEMIA